MRLHISKSKLLILRFWHYYHRILPTSRLTICSQYYSSSVIISAALYEAHFVANLWGEYYLWRFGSALFHVTHCRRVTLLCLTFFQIVPHLDYVIPFYPYHFFIRPKLHPRFLSAHGFTTQRIITFSPSISSTSHCEHLCIFPLHQHLHLTITQHVFIAYARYCFRKCLSTSCYNSRHVHSWKVPIIIWKSQYTRGKKLWTTHERIFAIDSWEIFSTARIYIGEKP